MNTSETGALKESNPQVCWRKQNLSFCSEHKHLRHRLTGRPAGFTDPLWIQFQLLNAKKSSHQIFMFLSSSFRSWILSYLN